jgi:osmotically-inducible protein OsmY
MRRSTRVIGLALVSMFGLSACAALQCSPENCATDAKITEDVRAVFAQHPEFGAPGTLQVQTINGVVYLNGESNSEMERRTAGALAKQVPNVKKVVNSINSRSNGR